MSKTVHIICNESPSPCDNGEAIDIFNQLREFKRNGVQVKLHYFENTRTRNQTFSPYCTEVNAYPVKKFSECFSFREPYLISSRINETLCNTIQNSNDPVLIHGSSCCGLLHRISNKKRNIVVRLHNEAGCNCHKHSYEKAPVSQMLFNKTQNLLMNNYVKKMPKDVTYACSSQSCLCNYTASGMKATYVPVFPNTQTITAEPGMGNLCLFHGNLESILHERTALWLLNNVFNKVRVPFVIAGKNPSNKLIKSAQLYQHVCLIANPTNDDLNDLIKKAHINILPAVGSKNTGTNLKLIHTLFQGRHCITSPEIVDGTGLSDAVYVGTTANAIASLISQLYYQPFEEREIILREKLLLEVYNNQRNIKKLEDILW